MMGKGEGADSGRLGAALVLAATLGALIWRWRIAGGLEPRWDQAGFFLWMEAALDSRHLLPQGGLEADDLSALHNILRPLAAQPHGLLLATDWLLSLPLLLVEGVRYSALLHSGMVLSALSVGLVSWTLVKRGGLAAAAIAAASLLFNAYSAHYSGFVLHNYGAFFLLLCAVTLEDNVAAGGRRRWGAALTVVLALYAHWTVLLLLTPAIGARLLFARELAWRRRATSLLQAGAGFALALAPMAAAVLVLPGRTSALTFLKVGEYQSQPLLVPLLHRIGFWFGEAGELFSYPGLAAGLIGLALLARRGYALPAWLAGTHFLLTALMPGFTWNGSNTYLRTYLYLVPLLSLGIGALVLEISSLRPFLALAAAVLVLGHFLPPLGQAMGMAQFARRSPAYQADYMAGQGELAATAQAFLPLLPEGAAVIPSGWGARDMMFAVTDRPSRHHHFPFTLENTLERAANGTLSDFFRRRGLDAAPFGRPFYVISDRPRDVASDLRRIFGALPGAPPEPAFDVQPLGQWTGSIESVFLYRINVAP